MQAERREIQLSPPFSNHSKTNESKRTIEHPEWIEKMFLRFIGAWPSSRFVYALQDKGVLEITKAEYYESLRHYDEDVIMQAISRAKLSLNEPPKISELLPIVTNISKDKKSEEERKMRDNKPATINRFSPAAIEARRKIRELFDKRIFREAGNTKCV